MNQKINHRRFFFSMLVFHSLFNNVLSLFFHFNPTTLVAFAVNVASIVFIWSKYYKPVAIIYTIYSIWKLSSYLFTIINSSEIIFYVVPMVPTILSIILAIIIALSKSDKAMEENLLSSERYLYERFSTMQLAPGMLLILMVVAAVIGNELCTYICTILYVFVCFVSHLFASSPSNLRKSNSFSPDSQIQLNYQRSDWKKIAIRYIAIPVALALIIIVSIASGGRKESKWDQLSDEEKEWYERNYGDGKSQEYDDAIDKYINSLS